MIMKKLNYLALFAFMISSLARAQAPGVIPDIYGKTYSDNAELRFGKASDFICSYLTVDTPDTMVCGTSLDSNAMLLVEKADVGFDFAHAVQTDPTLFVHSHNQSTSQWISLSHNGTNGVVDVGTGKVSFPDGIIADITGNVVGGVSTTSTIATTNTNAAGGSTNPLDVTSTLGIMDGSDDYTAVDINITNADHTGSGNTVQGVDISGITGDAQATETAINIGNGWDVGINAGNNSITTTGAVTSASLSVTGSLLSTSTTNIGWSVVSGANTACNTTCTNGCVFGQNTADMSIVDCANATANVCICAGAN